MDETYKVIWVNFDNDINNTVSFDDLTQAIKFYNFLIEEFITIRAISLRWGQSILLEYYNKRR